MKWLLWFSLGVITLVVSLATGAAEKLMIVYPPPGHSTTSDRIFCWALLPRRAMYWSMANRSGVVPLGILPLLCRCNWVKISLPLPMVVSR